VIDRQVLGSVRLIILALLFGGLASCGDDTEVGSELLSSEDLEVVEVDDFNLILRHIEPTPFTQLRATPALRPFIGTLDNRFFGKAESSVYVRPVINLFPVFEGGEYDSVAITIPVDTMAIFGAPNAQNNFEVFRLLESLDMIDTTTTDQEFMVSQEPIGVLDKVNPLDLDSTLIINFMGDSTYVNNLIRIPLDPAYGQEIFDDPGIHADLAGFANNVNGFLVKSRSNNSLLQLDLLNQNSSLIFYYKDSLGTSRNFQYSFGGIAPLNFTYDIAGSNMEEAIANEASQEEFYLQGHAGTTIEIDVSDITREDDKFINLVTLEFFVSKEFNQDTTLFPLPTAFDLMIKGEDGNLTPIQDIQNAQTSGLVDILFDGNREVTDDAIRYKMNITNYVKALFDGSEDQTLLYLTVRNRVQSPNNVVLYGPQHPTYPTKLKLTYTKS